MAMTEGEKMVWAATYSLVFQEWRRTPRVTKEDVLAFTVCAAVQEANRAVKSLSGCNPLLDEEERLTLFEIRGTSPSDKFSYNCHPVPFFKFLKPLAKFNLSMFSLFFSF